MRSKKKVLIIVIVLAILSLCSCTLLSVAIYKLYTSWRDKREDKIASDSEPELNLSDSMGFFSNDDEFDEYAQNISQNLDEISEDETPAWGDGEDAAPMAMEEEGTQKESITNVQEAGVDEGDIVKAYKDYLIVLRRGRIFTIKIKDKNNDILEPVSKVDAYPKDFTKGTWYDEMLIYKDTIVVVGYSYEMSATEIGLFSVNDDGIIQHSSTHFLDSNDYYSSRNYASRLVDNQLIFYTPYYLFTWDYTDEDYVRKTKLPQIKEWITADKTTEGQDILAKTDIYKPVQDTLSPTLHMIVKCDLDSSTLDCKAKAILGPYSRNFYVSPNAVYIWVSETPYYWYYNNSEDTEDKAPDSYVYMMLLKDESARALKADGTPIDQFSFKEGSDGYLNVVVRENSTGDAMWNSEFTSGGLALMRVSLEQFTNTPELVSRDVFTILPKPEGSTFQNRFVGGYLLYGTGSNWYYDEDNEYTLYVKNYKISQDVQNIELTHSVDRIEFIGDGAVIVGTDEDNLKFSSIELARNSELKDTYIIEDAVQGELRSHGFFYKSYADDTGILGLPIRREGESYEHLFNESAEVIFLKVNTNKEFLNIGALEASPPERENDNCEFSCVDWYGNSRPIFYSDRIFALMGYELVEGNLVRNQINEIYRLNYLK